MIFTDPVPFAEALKADAVRTLLPTELRTKDLAQIEPALLARARVSAGVANVNLLQEIDDVIEAGLRGDLSRADMRVRLKEVQGSLGAEVDDTDLTDTRSNARLNLIIDTNLAQAQGYGQALQGAQSDVLDQWPAQELVRVIDSAEPRDWARRWEAAGGQRQPDGRMIALKSDPIWAAISRFGTPYPPFDFNSGMDVQDIDRDEAEAIGLLAPDEEASAPDLPDFNAELQATPDVRAGYLRDALEEGLKGFAEFAANGVLRLVGGGS